MRHRLERSAETASRPRRRLRDSLHLARFAGKQGDELVCLANRPGTENNGFVIMVRGEACPRVRPEEGAFWQGKLSGERDRVSAQNRLSRTRIRFLATLLCAQGGSCFYCGAAIAVRAPGNPHSATDATVDHFFPRARGGAEQPHNWVLACISCNGAKGDRAPSQQEVERWNELALRLAGREPVDLSLFEVTRCQVCSSFIDPARLSHARRSGTATVTCRRECRVRPGASASPSR